MSGGLVGCGLPHPTKPPDLHPHPPSPINQSTHNLQSANSYNCTQLTPKTASVVPPEDGRLTPETCRGLRHNKVIVTMNVGPCHHDMARPQVADGGTASSMEDSCE